MMAAAYGCGESGAPAPAPAVEATDEGFGEPDATYTVRGQIMSMPSVGPPPTDLRIQHEHIPDFKGADGNVIVNPAGVTGMRAMTMSFPLVAPEIDISGYKAGDKVAMTMQVRWVPLDSGRSRALWRVVTLEKLPDDTVIDLSNKPFPGAETPPPPAETVQPATPPPPGL